MTDPVQAADTAPTYVHYREDLEQPRSDEADLVDKIVKVLHRNNVRAYKKYKHGIRDAHAKSHAILRGDLTVLPDLDDKLRQGLFATPATYPVIARYSTTSGAIRSDRIRGVHGLGIKVLGVQGERALPDDDATTQDFVLVTHREFAFADARAYYRKGMPVAWVLARLPDPALNAVTEALAAVARVLKRFGRPFPPAFVSFIEPNTNMLGQTFYSSAPLRYGEYVAKFEFAPASESVTSLTPQLVPRDAGKDAYRQLFADFFTGNSAQYDVRVQLCTDLEKMPIEDATVAWPEDLSKHRRVATITFGAQNPYSPARAAFGDDVLSFNSWRALAEHRPLGSINRLKRLVYEASSDFRHQVNSVARVEPTDIAQLPD